ncbi:ras-related protein Rap-2c isoform X2 [Equus quagga]|uniref:ras-related protein Rap-2c isoform X2 n=1 Tax=Equus quagga TaxID=89248 RepID=UPI001EE242F5|nr:ras-related protein Rap-2c isoform X2 [Equus quagga]
MSGVLPVVRLLLAVLHRPTSGSSPRPGWGRLRRGGVSEVWGWDWRAGGERKDAGGSQTGPPPRPSAGPEAVRSHRPPPSRSAGRGPAPPGSPPRGRTTPAAAAAQSPARAAATGAEPAGLGRLGVPSRKRGPGAPLCAGRGRGAGQPAGPALRPPPSGGASRLPPR